MVAAVEPVELDEAESGSVEIDGRAERLWQRGGADVGLTVGSSVKEPEKEEPEREPKGSGGGGVVVVVKIDSPPRENSEDVLVRSALLIGCAKVTAGTMPVAALFSVELTTTGGAVGVDVLEPVP